MKRALAVLSLSLAAACDSEEKPPPPLFGGFAPQDGAAVILPSIVCTLPVVGSAALSGIGIELGDYVGVCNTLSSIPGGFCGAKADATTMAAVAAKGVPGAGSVSAAGPGTYPYLAAPPAGPFQGAIARAVVDGPYPQCTAVAGPLDMIGGSVTISAVDGTHVAGSVDATFEDGSVFQGSFDVALCPLSLDLCAVLGPCFGYTCVP